jgi:DNA-binding transcriptional LysR family regulator
MDQRYRKFLTLVNFGSFSAAARELRVSQPAITISIASLERSLGKKLITRKRHAIELTHDGEIVYETAKKIDEVVRQMQDRLRTGVSEPIAHIGLIDSIAHLLYSSSKERPLLANIEVMVDNSRRIISDVLANQIDFGFITGQPEALDKEIVTYKLHDEPFVFVTSPAKAPDQPVTEISNWLAFNQDSTTYRHFVKQFNKYGLTVVPTFYSTSLDLLKDMAIAGNGAALLPRHFVEAAIENKLLVIVDTEPMYRPIWIISRKNDAKPSVFEPLAAKINELLARLG